ncbi:MAG: hypothetical protein HYT36_02390 [Candidatus Staskawiczbacteria bacterium]|nr:hypothetical protein [Candidatus Staskawiczbacteria bacterium]
MGYANSDPGINKSAEEAAEVIIKSFWKFSKKISAFLPDHKAKSVRAPSSNKFAGRKKGFAGYPKKTKFRRWFLSFLTQKRKKQASTTTGHQHRRRKMAIENTAYSCISSREAADVVSRSRQSAATAMAAGKRQCRFLVALIRAIEEAKKMPQK